MSDYTHGAGVRGLESLLASGVAFDGLVAQSDQQGAAAINGFARRNTPVPNAVKVVGVDDSPFCEFVIVPLTSVSQEFHRRGQEAIRLLTRLIDGDLVASTSVAPDPARSRVDGGPVVGRGRNAGRIDQRRFGGDAEARKRKD